MIPLLVMAAALAPLTVVRPESLNASTPRYVLLHLRVSAYGVPGTGTIAIDRRSGAFVRRFDVGPASDQEGFNGRVAWRADATGFPRVEGNRDEVGAVRLWSHVLSGAGPSPAIVRTENNAAARSTAVRVSWPDVPRVADASFDPKTTLLTAIVRRYAGERGETRFSDYRTVDRVVVPFKIVDVSDNGTWVATVTTATFPQRLARAMFEPPTRPDDVLASAPATVPMLGSLEQPVITVRLNDGPPLKMILDTGGQNVITPKAARRLGLDVVGGGRVSGVGSQLATTQFAWVRRMTVGRTTLRRQSFIVLDFGLESLDGVVGYELLARVGARLDFARRRVTFLRNAAMLPLERNAVELPFVFDDRQPQVGGAVGTLAGALTIDTGADGTLGIPSPAVTAHRLLERYHSVVCGPLVGGVGGKESECLARVAFVRLGRAQVDDPIIGLTIHSSSGATADPSTIGNVGDEILGRFTLDLDYPRQRLTLSRNGTPLPAPSGDLSGIKLASEGRVLRAAIVLTGTPAYAAGLRAGATIVAVNGKAVSNRDRGRVVALFKSAAGTHIVLHTRDGRIIAFRLQRYL